MSRNGCHIDLHCHVASRRDRRGLQGYDLAYSAINHTTNLMEAVIVDKLGYPNTSIIQ